MDKLQVSYRFLRENAALNGYNREMLRYRKNFRQHVLHYSPYNLISSAFPWYRTAEGEDFWARLDIKVRQTLYTVTDDEQCYKLRTN